MSLHETGIGQRGAREPTSHDDFLAECQLQAWYAADHECGGKDRGRCGACDAKADSFARAFRRFVEPVVCPSLVNERRESKESEKDDSGAALLPGDPSATVTTEPLPNMTRQAADFIAVSFKARIKHLLSAADARCTYEGDYAPAVRYYAAANKDAAALLQRRLDALNQVGSGNQSSQATASPPNAQEGSAETSSSLIPSVESAKEDFNCVVWARINLLEYHRAHGLLFPGMDERNKELHKLIDALILAVQQQSAQEIETGWQPIEMAPKDGTDIIICDGNDLVGHGFFNRADKVWCWLDMDVVRDPRAWQPLPSPPQESR